MFVNYYCFSIDYITESYSEEQQVIPSPKRKKLEEESMDQKSPYIATLLGPDKLQKTTLLTYIATTFGVEDKYNVLMLMDCLLQCLPLESNTQVAVLEIDLLATIASQPYVDPNPIVELLYHQVTERPKAASEVLQALNRIGQRRPSTRKLAIAAAERELLSVNTHSPNRQASVKISAMELLANFGEQFDDRNLHSCFENYLFDADARVRKSALASILATHSRGFQLDVGLYTKAISLLVDDHEDVRLEALRLVSILSKLYPTHAVTSSKATKTLTLAGDAFMKISNMMADISTRVRTEVCILLGQFDNVPEDLLLQALSKRMLRVELEQQVENKTMVDPQEPQGGTEVDVVRVENVNLVDSGAAGALVHGLEDEFYEVRSAAIDTIRIISLRSPQFAARAVEFLVDMFHDEIEVVRANAINSLAQLGHICQLNEQQLHLLLSNLIDLSSSVRQAVRNLLQSTTICNVATYHAVIQALLRNISDYARDTDAVYDCLRYLGQNHPQYTEMLLEDLLKMDFRFLQKEPMLDDVFYQAILVTIFNSAAKSHRIVSRLPGFSRRHYHFMRDRFESLIPLIPAYEIDIPHCAVDDKSHDLTVISHRIAATFGELRVLFNEKRRREALRVCTACKRELNRIIQLHPRWQALAEFNAIVVQCVELVIRLCDRNNIPAIISGSLQSPPSLHPAIPPHSTSLQSQLVYLSYYAENAFSGLSDLSITLLRVLRIIGSVADLLAKEGTQVDENELLGEDSKRQATTLLLQRIEVAAHFCRQKQMEMPLELQYFIDRALPEIDPQKDNFMTLLNLLSDCILPLPTAPLTVTSVSARIHKPQSNFDKAVEFLFFVPHVVVVEGTIFNIDSVVKLFVEIRYPDQSQQYFSIKPDDVVQIGHKTYSFATKVKMTQNAWTEKSAVSISVVKAIDTDSQLAASTLDMKGKLDPTFLGETVLVPLTASPLQYYIFPKAR